MQSLHHHHHGGHHHGHHHYSVEHSAPSVLSLKSGSCYPVGAVFGVDQYTPNDITSDHSVFGMTAPSDHHHHGGHHHGHHHHYHKF